MTGGTIRASLNTLSLAARPAPARAAKRDRALVKEVAHATGAAAGVRFVRRAKMITPYASACRTLMAVSTGV